VIPRKKRLCFVVAIYMFTSSSSMILPGVDQAEDALLSSWTSSLPARRCRAEGLTTARPMINEQSREQQASPSHLCDHPTTTTAASFTTTSITATASHSSPSSVLISVPFCSSSYFSSLDVSAAQVPHLPSPPPPPLLKSSVAMREGPLTTTHLVAPDVSPSIRLHLLLSELRRYEQQRFARCHSVLVRCLAAATEQEPRQHLQQLEQRLLLRRVALFHSYRNIILEARQQYCDATYQGISVADQHRMVSQTIRILATYHPWSHTITARTMITPVCPILSSNCACGGLCPYYPCEQDEVVVHSKLLATTWKQAAKVERMRQQIAAAAVTLSPSSGSVGTAAIPPILV
jgi:hypothetical protein